MLLGLAGCTEKTDPEPTKSTPTTTRPVQVADLTFGVFGSTEETVGFQAMVRRFNAVSDTSTVRIRRWQDSEQAVRDIDRGHVPDVFLVSRQDLAALVEDKKVRPVDQLLDARGVDFGDDYARDALRAFSANEALQCMPFSISPMVIFYNTDLIDFETMRAQGLAAPKLDDEGRPPRSWSFDQFMAAAKFGTKPRKQIKGLAIEPNLRGLAPFVLSGGGSLFDDAATPSSLALSDDGSVDALERTLTLLRDGSLNLSQTQLDRGTPMQWFKRGKVAMVAGFRDSVPSLRRVQGLEWDVMPMPNLDRQSTIGDISGLCISADSPTPGLAADFLTYAIGSDAVGLVAREGFMVPANLTVGTSDVFLQEGRAPRNSRAFIQAVPNIYVPPMIDVWPELDAATAPGLHQLVQRTVLDRDGILDITSQIDEESVSLLAPDSTGSPTGSPTSR
jgi:multiple sugar transport system substrate-binding protein